MPYEGTKKKQEFRASHLQPTQSAMLKHLNSISSHTDHILLLDVHHLKDDNSKYYRVFKTAFRRRAFEWFLQQKRNLKSTYSRSKLLVKLINEHKVYMFLCIIICKRRVLSIEMNDFRLEAMNLKLQVCWILSKYPVRLPSRMAETFPHVTSLQVCGNEKFRAAHGTLQLTAKSESPTVERVCGLRTLWQCLLHHWIPLLDDTKAWCQTSKHDNEKKLL